MENNEYKRIPDTSPEDSPSPKPSTSKNVRWDDGVKDSTGPESRNDSRQRMRRQSLMGTSGFVSQILEQHLPDDYQKYMDETENKPMRRQTLAERRETIIAVDADLKYYLQEATFPKPKKNASSTLKLKTIKMESGSKENLAFPLPDEARPSSKWKPSHILEEETVGEEQERSWVGTYIIGKDYWSEEKQNNQGKKSKKVNFTLDEEKTPWYDMPIRRSGKESKLHTIKSRSLDKIEALKGEMDEEYEIKRKQRMISAAHAREEPPVVVEEWSEEFKQCFKDVARKNSFSTRGTHVSMPDADKWLEKAGILDHAELTLVHTGLYFLAVGGSRYRGLSFDDFTQFLQMISQTCGVALKDVVRRLTACQRDEDDEKQSSSQ